MLSLKLYLKRFLLDMNRLDLFYLLTCFDDILDRNNSHTYKIREMIKLGRISNDICAGTKFDQKHRIRISKTRPN